jgi:hypothetical protein
MEHRLVVIDRDGQLRPSSGEQPALRGEEMFVVVVLWDVELGAWLGWLTTSYHRSLSFSAADLEDPAFQRWLAELPGWDSRKLSLALGTPGLHLVWRRPAPLTFAAS